MPNISARLILCYIFTQSVCIFLVKFSQFQFSNVNWQTNCCQCQGVEPVLTQLDTARLQNVHIKTCDKCYIMRTFHTSSNSSLVLSSSALMSAIVMPYHWSVQQNTSRWNFVKILRSAWQKQSKTTAMVQTDRTANYQWNFLCDMDICINWAGTLWQRPYHI